MKITPYQSEDGKWLAMLDFGGNCTMPFFAASKADAVAKAESFLAREKERQRRLLGSAMQEPGEPETLTSGNPGGRGVMFVGKVWMLNRQTGERARVDAGKVAGYEARGFVRGGPRSK